jgi:hypothetical protein
VAEPCDHDTFLSKFGEKDRKGIARHLALYEEKLGREAAERWCRFAHTLMALAPFPAKFVAQQAVQFYVPDGKYRMQVFALQATEDGSLAIYAGDILDQSFRVGILFRAKLGDTRIFRIHNSPECLTIDTLDGHSAGLAPACKAMTGWNRKAICITLPPNASAVQMESAASLCALATTDWDVAPPVSRTQPVGAGGLVPASRSW